eukprot:gnl/Spiro4/12174_TR6420_c0_g3_i1.p1 gnl/Spiro4/12174_TR6420_c0_g3~~gnl/Spiro4/12174_TR6420_c0_g3_i1.p1  ORF type:complete len:583 (-),score=165.48 gnl/Spiro4/12174_TR6420_c0_g3_i1:78-1826(-)
MEDELELAWSTSLGELELDRMGINYLSDAVHSIGLLATSEGQNVITLIHVYDPADARSLRRVHNQIPSLLLELDRQSLVRMISFNKVPSPALLAVATLDNQIHVWHISIENSQISAAKLMVVSVPNRARGLCWHPVQPHILLVWDADTIFFFDTFSPTRGLFMRFPKILRGVVSHVAWGTAGTTLCVASDVELLISEWRQGVDSPGTWERYHLSHPLTTGQSIRRIVGVGPRNFVVAADAQFQIPVGSRAPSCAASVAGSDIDVGDDTDAIVDLRHLKSKLPAAPTFPELVSPAAHLEAASDACQICLVGLPPLPTKVTEKAPDLLKVAVGSNLRVLGIKLPDLMVLEPAMNQIVVGGTQSGLIVVLQFAPNPNTPAMPLLHIVERKRLTNDKILGLTTLAGELVVALLASRVKQHTVTSLSTRALFGITLCAFVFSARMGFVPHAERIAEPKITHVQLAEKIERLRETQDARMDRLERLLLQTHTKLDWLTYILTDYVKKQQGYVMPTEAAAGLAHPSKAAQPQAPPPPALRSGTRERGWERADSQNSGPSVSIMEPAHRDDHRTDPARRNRRRRPQPPNA